MRKICPFLMIEWIMPLLQAWKRGEAMGVIYAVIPVLPNEMNAVMAWLGSLGIADPEGEGRYPS
jgi:hypothetical protein